MKQFVVINKFNSIYLYLFNSHTPPIILTMSQQAATTVSKLKKLRRAKFAAQRSLNPYTMAEGNRLGFIPSDYQQRYLVTPRLVQQRLDVAQLYGKTRAMDLTKKRSYAATASELQAYGQSSRGKTIGEEVQSYKVNPFIPLFMQQQLFDN